jgi:transcription elongation factor
LYARDVGEKQNPGVIVSECSRVSGVGATDLHEARWDCTNMNPNTLNSTTNPLTATALIYALGAGITAGAGTRLVLQLILDIGWF